MVILESRRWTKNQSRDQTTDHSKAVHNHLLHFRFKMVPIREIGDQGRPFHRSTSFYNINKVIVFN